MKIRTSVFVGTILLGAGAAFAQVPASSPNSGVDKPSNAGVGMARPPGSTGTVGYGETTGSVVVAPANPAVPAVDPTFSQPTPMGSAGSSGTGPGASPYDRR